MHALEASDAPGVFVHHQHAGLSRGNAQFGILVRGVGYRQVAPPQSVQAVVGICNGRGRGNGYYLAQAYGSAGDGKACALDNQRLNFGKLVGAEEVQGRILLRGDAVLQGVALAKRKAHAHDHSAFYLTFHVGGIYRLSHVVGGYDLEDLVGFLVDDADLGGVAVGYVALGVRKVRTEGVRFGKVLCVEVVALKLLQRVFFKGFPELERGAARSFARDGGVARARGSSAVRGVEGVGFLLQHEVPVKAGRVAYDLLEDGAKSLSHAGAAAVDDHCTALDLEAHAPVVGKSHAHACVLHGAGDSGVLCALVGILHGKKGFDKACGLVDYLAVGEALTGPDCISVSDFPVRDAHLVGHVVQKALHGEAGLRHSEAPEGSGRGIVGVPGIAVHFYVAETVGAGGMRAGALEHGQAERGVGSGVSRYGGLQGLYDSVFVAAQGELHVHGVALGVHCKAFLAGELHLARAPGEVCDKGAQVLDRDVFLSAEASSDIAVLNKDLFLGKAQHGGRLAPRVVDSLVRGEDPHAAVLSGDGDCALGLKEGMLRPRGGEALLDYMGAFFQSCIRIAALYVGVAQEVSALMDLGGVLPHGLVGVSDAGKDLVADLHQLRGLLCLIVCLCRNEADDIADVARDLSHAYHGVPVADDVSDLHVAGNVVRGIDSDYIGNGEGQGGIDFKDPGARVFAPHGNREQHVRKVDVVGIDRLSRYLVGDVHAGDALSGLPPAVVADSLVLLQHLRGQAYALDYLHVACAAADVVAYGVADVQF